MEYTYYALPLADFTRAEINNGEAGEIETFDINVPVYPGGDANEESSNYVDVTVVAPKGYNLTDKDHARIDEMINE